jgi:hypothetical protein
MRDRFCHWTCYAAGLLLAVGSGTDLARCQDPDSGASQAATDAEIQAWVRALDSDQFLEREIASQQLAKSGAAGIPALLEAIPKESKEVTTRAIHILQQIAQDSDPLPAATARAALEQVAEARGTPAASRARMALQRVAAYWAARAVDQLVKRGAELSRAETPVGLQLNASLTMQIGDRWKGQLEDLQLLRWLTDVDELVLEGPKVTDRWLPYVAAVTGVPSLTIKRAGITDAGIKQLASLTDVSTVTLMYLPITDQSIESLGQMKRVSVLRIYGGKITREGAERLKQQLVWTRVDHRQGGFLGVGCQTLPQGCVVFTVREETAAERAGIAEGDVIVSYAGKQVESFEQLTEMIGDNAAGETVTVELQRGAERITKRITLGAW